MNMKQERNNMKILSVETSGKICAVALTEDNKIIKEEII